jgi:ABC-2 type transport system permease protein
MIFDFNAISILWLREMKRFFRAKSRIFGTLAMPILTLAFFSMGLYGVQLPGIPPEVDYVNFLLPGVIGATILFSSMFSGISVIWDKEFGFPKEIMITPVSRLSILLGRIAGSATISIFQGSIILFVSMLFLNIKKPSIEGVGMALIYMTLIAILFISLGLIFASRMSDIQGFNVIMNFMIYPMFLLSGAMLPIARLPKPIYLLAYANPLTYGIDGLRASLMKFSTWDPTFDLIVLSGFTVFFVVLSAYLFSKSAMD